MALEAALRAEFDQDVKVENPTAESHRGEKTYGAPATWKGRLEGTNRVIRTSDGTEVTATGELFLVPEATIQQEARVTVAATVYRAIRIDAERDFEGLHHYRVFLEE